MNYLAHALLSGDDPELLVGNFIADHVRNAEIAAFTPGIREGIRLHRAIDSFTDSHSAFRESKRLFYEGFERHSGILVDIYFDHILAAGFEEYAGCPLSGYSEKVYRVYKAGHHQFPVPARRFLDYVLSNRVYEGYATEAGIRRVLAHLSGRIRHNVHLDDSYPLFRGSKSKLEEAFRAVIGEARSIFTLGTTRNAV